MKLTFKNKKQAFTLIELLIVIAIIGILFIVLISRVDFATDKAKMSGVQTDFRSFQMAFEQVSRENAGFNTLGWDTGDIGGLTSKTGANEGIFINGQMYSYTNAAKDRGDKIRNSYDVGDLNLNGELDSNETWTGRKIYTENWTDIYVLDNPCIAGDAHFNDNAIIDLENAINKNLDPKLHITINPDTKEITMANGYQDPWNTEYHGFYLSNAAVDNMDRGAIVMYSNGENKAFGCEQNVTNGKVLYKIPGGNIQGKDDLSTSTIYTFLNGYGEIKTTTMGFGQNQGDADISITASNPLASKYELAYYKDFYALFNGSPSTEQTVDIQIATYTDENGKDFIAFVNNATYNYGIVIPSNFNVNLNGKKVVFEGNYGFVFSGEQQLIGTTAGSKVVSCGTSVQCESGSRVTVLGGQYSTVTDGLETQTSPIPAMFVKNNAELTVDKVNINSIDKFNGSVNCIKNDGTLIVLNSNLLVDAEESLDNNGIYSTGICICKNSTIIAKADYTANAAGTNYASNSRAILSDGEDSVLELYNCTVWGSHSGVTARGQLKVEGGTYEGYGHGGIYVAGPAGANIYIKDAAINLAAMKEGTYADDVAGCNEAAFYFGGCSNVNLYIDNCTFNTTFYGIVVRGSGGEQNNMLYISNSQMNFSKYSCRMSSYSSRAYIGIGNNFNAETTSVPGNCFETTETYR